jgi:hypothetical protein
MSITANGAPYLLAYRDLTLYAPLRAVDPAWAMREIDAWPPSYLLSLWKPGDEFSLFVPDALGAFTMNAWPPSVVGRAEIRPDCSEEYSLFLTLGGVA